MARTGFRPDIQGLRALAVLLVMSQHLGIPGGSGGFVGVDVFLVISGFLITGYIVERVSAGTFSFGEFYARRVRRLLPAALVTIVATVAAAALLLTPTQVREVSQDGAASAVYVPNLWFDWQSWEGLAGERSAFGHYWSLGLEEQFYLVWPLLLVGAYALARRRAVLAVAMGVVFVLSLAASIAYSPGDPISAYYLLHTRGWEFALGGLTWLALSHPGVHSLGGAWSIAVAPAGFALIAIGFIVCRDLVFPGWSALLPTVGAAAVILGGVWAPGGIGTRLLSLGPAVWLGTISYSLYLVHLPMVVVPQHLSGEPMWGPLRLLAGALAVGVAWAMWRYVEEPWRLPRTADAGGWKAVGVGLVTSMGVGAAVLGLGALA